MKGQREERGLVAELEDAPKVHSDVAGSRSHAALEPGVGLLALALVKPPLFTACVRVTVGCVLEESFSIP